MNFFVAVTLVNYKSLKRQCQQTTENGKQKAQKAQDVKGRSHANPKVEILIRFFRDYCHCPVCIIFCFNTAHLQKLLISNHVMQNSIISRAILDVG